MEGKARWGAALGPETLALDPFADQADQADFDRLTVLVQREAAFTAEVGGCGLKDLIWTEPRCGDCPFQGHYGELCRIGVEQQEIVVRRRERARQ